MFEVSDMTHTFFPVNDGSLTLVCDSPKSRTHQFGIFTSPQKMERPGRKLAVSPDSEDSLSFFLKVFHLQCLGVSLKDLDITGKQVAVNFHQLYP